MMHLVGGYENFRSLMAQKKTVLHYCQKAIPLSQNKAKIIGYDYVWSGDKLSSEIPLYADGTPNYTDAIHWLYKDDSNINNLLKAANDDTVTCQLRFPGQYEDNESGLFYNRHRYYDPETAQYLSPDPIGLMGGINPYGYVHNPTGWVDPLGLVGACNDVKGTTAQTTQKWSVDPSTQAADEAAGVLVEGNYIKNPTAKDFSGLLTDSGRVGSKNMNGQFMYVIDEKGNIIIGTRGKDQLTGETLKMPHPTLIGGKDPQVLGAGMVDIRAGKIYSIDNASGHFKPGASSLDAAQQAFGKLPDKYFSKDFQGYVPYQK